MNQAFEDFRGDYLKKEFGHGMAIYIIINMEEEEKTLNRIYAYWDYSSKYSCLGLLNTLIFSNGKVPHSSPDDKGAQCIWPDVLNPYFA